MKLNRKYFFIKVLLILLITYPIYNIYIFIKNYNEYNLFCYEKNIACEHRYIITTKQLIELKGEFEEHDDTFSGLSPLQSEKDEYQSELDILLENAVSELKEINIDFLNKNQINAFNENQKITTEISEQEIVTVFDYKNAISELEKVSSSNEILSKTVEVNQKKDELSKKLNELEDIANADEQKTLDYIKSDFDLIKYSKTNDYTIDQLIEIEEQIIQQFDLLKNLQTKIEDRIKKEDEARKAAANSTSSNSSSSSSGGGSGSSSSGSSSSGSSSSSNSGASSSGSSSGSSSSSSGGGSSKCYSSYEEAYQVGLNKMLNDEKIQKFSVDSNNCPQYQY